MSIHNARSFVAKMRDDHKFRKKVLGSKGQEDLSVFLQADGMKFDQWELVGAMTECMEQLELQTKKS